MDQAATWIFDRTADHLALDFANSVSGRHTDAPIDRIPSYRELVEFARQTALVAPDRADALDRWAVAHPGEARAIHARARALRDALYRIAVACAADQPPEQADLDALDGERVRLALDPSLRWRWRAGDDAPDALLGPIVTAALELLTSDAHRRLHMCEADDCLWVFLDTSKNATRRWCDMKQCGNRMKARRYSARQKRSGRAPA